MPPRGKNKRTREQQLQDFRVVKMRRALMFLSRTTEGFTSKEIAAQVYLDHSTVRANLAWLYKQLNAATNAQAVAAAFRKGLLK